MATEKFLWRTKSSSASTKYVDSRYGSDQFGDGTMEKPYQSLNKAWSASETRPSTIVCRGTFSEQMLDGNHSCTIKGDYYGAATFDGRDGYTCYGFTHTNMKFVNCKEAQNSWVVPVGSGSLAGVGRASAAGNVGVGSVHGFSGSSNSANRCGLYFGAIGGVSIKKCIYANLKANENYLINLAGNYTTAAINSCTIYGVDVNLRRKNICNYAQYPNKIINTVFSKFAMIANDLYQTYEECFFASDCKWYWFNGNTAADGYEEITFASGVASAEEIQAFVKAKGITEEDAKYPHFVNCVFSKETEKELFNNAAKDDFTLKVSSEAIKALNEYYGALPPSLNVPIVGTSRIDSDGIVGCFDNRTLTGCLSVENGNVCYNDMAEEKTGSITSKIITIDPEKMQISEFFCQSNPKNDIAMNAAVNMGEPVGDEGNPLKEGWYVVKGAPIIYKEQNLLENAVFVVSKEDELASLRFTPSAPESKVVPVLDPNIMEVVYCRCRSAIYRYVGSSELEAGGTYLNAGGQTITYNGRKIVPNESFIAERNALTFDAPIEGYKVAAMFDCTGVPSSVWVPAQLWGEYFASKSAGVIDVDKNGVALGSGNHLAWQKSADGGYAEKLHKSIINQPYLQLKICVRK